MYLFFIIREIKIYLFIFFFLFEESFIKFQIFLWFCIHLLTEVKKQINEFIYLCVSSSEINRIKNNIEG